MHRTSLHRLAALLAAAAVLGAGIPTALRAASFPPLNDPPTGQQFPGKFIWGDLFTSEPQTAAAFYCGLLGWTSSAPVEEHDKSYILLSNNGYPVAGIAQRPASEVKRPGIWIGYISVIKAKTALAAAVAAGGVEHAAVRNFPHLGIQAILSDSEGSVLGIMQSTSGDRADDEPSAGDWNWFELYSLQPKSTADFYQRVFGYEVTADSRKTGHLLFSAGGRARAGLAPLPVSPDSSPGWLGCIRVADVDEAAAKTITLGGQVLVAPRRASLGSRYAVITDPTGGAVALVQYVDNANPANRP